MMVTRVWVINNGDKVDTNAKLKYPVNSKANLFAVTLPYFFCHHIRPATNPIKRMALKVKIELIVCSII